MRFVILNHPIEMKRRIATGRMSHLCLEKSWLIVGHDYTHNPQVNAIIANPAFHCVILYPGQRSVNLSPLSRPDRRALFPRDKELVIFVIDGTWATARQTAWQSQNLKSLPRVCFTPPAPSNFRVRKQPRPECFSTIEAIHHTIELLGDGSRRHDVLLDVFNRMVDRQVAIRDSSLERSRSPMSCLLQAPSS